MKLHFVCQEIEPEWWSCYGLTSHGFMFAQHVCSHPAFAPGDLYFDRPERKKVLELLFGKVWERDETETNVVTCQAETPPCWDAMDEKTFGEISARYKEIMAEHPGNFRGTETGNPSQP